ncbi:MULTISPECIES: glycosyltransferase family 2 protein [unclassified Pseudonocardia]|uniref:glycosyltransferase family 2 protein n=1 Tax=unclassified Pseudonocardia TaxID=2619320 RepID=UPI0009623CE0|nr:MULTISPECIES: glycosyltransferase family 2 protein [unclassified Pseudonocardia]OLL76162.1 glycosyl transferase, family 2 [Pseudonocardia sp. Ae150A_Ps1]OLL83725.1 glycosyl transferase, family 2 [Pseudonocardia sp. Ae263_Ps1]
MSGKSATPDAVTWVGELDRLAPLRDLRVGPGFHAARLLVTVGGTPQGQVTVPLRNGHATIAELNAALITLSPPEAVVPAPVGSDPVTVVVATRNRPESLARCLRAVLASDHPALSVVVVDNDPDDERTQQAVTATGSPRVRYVREPRRGASVGRNRGLAEARTDLVAFTDDDTEVDPAWASRIAGAFAADPDLACVSGPVLAARLGSPEERAADTALAWNKGFTARRFSLAAPPPDSPIFPFAPGLLGIGANLAVRATAARSVGGFDEAMGPGTPTHGGEDGEFLVRMILAGHVLGYLPGAYLWHHHRPDQEALRKQMEGYAVGLGSFLAKVALSPQGRSAALRRLPAAVARLRHISAREAGAGDAMPADADQTRTRGMLNGPRAYLQSRRAVRRAGGAVPPLMGFVGPAVVPGHRTVTASGAFPAAGQQPAEDGERAGTDPVVPA